MSVLKEIVKSLTYYLEIGFFLHFRSRYFSMND